MIKSKNAFSYEMEMESRLSWFTHNMCRGSKKATPDGWQITFNKTRVKGNENNLIAKEFKVRRILPLVQVEGLIYITQSRIYFQPYHNIYDKEVINFKIDQFTEFFKRRFKLMDIGL